MMKRTPEPELMDEVEQARAYAEADFSEPNQAFVERLLSRWSPQGRVVDLGCGPADIPRRLAQCCPALHIDATDGSPAMLELAQRTLDSAGLTARVSLHQGLLQELDLPGGSYTAVLSNSLLHHLHQPELLWRSVRRLAKPGAWVLVMDLMRPASAEAARALVSQYAADAPPVLQRDFLASLHAAFTVEEVRDQLSRAGLCTLEVAATSDRHLVVEGQVPEG